MKCLLPLFSLLFIAMAGKAQTNIELSEIPKHIGDSVRVCGKIYSSRFLEKVASAPTLLNMGAAYPDQILTLVIYGENRKKFGVAPELEFKDQEVCAQGKLELFRDLPQIVLSSSKQLVPVRSRDQ